MLEKGLNHTSETVVTVAVSAQAMGSGDMEVFATPAMVALMENAAMNAVAGSLSAGQTTVGTAMSVSHIKATAVGDSVSATAVLMAIDGRELTFEVSACDSGGKIGEGIHKRFIVDRERFLSKAAAGRK